MIELLTDGEAIEPTSLLSLYRDHDWWTGRTADDVERAIEGSDIVVGIEDDGRLIASARVLTDYVYYASIYDVIVAADRRGEGLGQRLVDAVVEHPELASVEAVHLDCGSDLVPFYESAGFTSRDLGSDFETMVLRDDR